MHWWLYRLIASWRSLLTLKLLFLLPLSCMVAPIRELVNKSFSTSAFNLQPQQIAQLSFNIDIDINLNITRGRSAPSSKLSSRKSLTYSNASSAPYYKRIEAQNNFLNEDIWKPVNNSQLSYKFFNKQKEKLVSKVADNSL